MGVKTKPEKVVIDVEVIWAQLLSDLYRAHKGSAADPFLHAAGIFARILYEHYHGGTVDWRQVEEGIDTLNAQPEEPTPEPTTSKRGYHFVHCMCGNPYAVTKQMGSGNAVSCPACHRTTGQSGVAIECGSCGDYYAFGDDLLVADLLEWTCQFHESREPEDE